MRAETTKNFSSSKHDDSEDYDSDLDINFHRLKLDDCVLANDDFDSRTQLDPSVWKCSEKSLLNSKPMSSSVSTNNNGISLSKVQISTPTRQIVNQQGILPMDYMFSTQQQQQAAQQPTMPQTPQVKSYADALQMSTKNQQQSQQQRQQNQASLAHQTSLLKQLIGAPQAQPPPTKILSLEEIERNMINQQQQQKMIQEKLAAIAKIPNQNPVKQQQQILSQQNQIHPQSQHVQNQQVTVPGRQPPIFPPHPLLNANRIPPGFPAPNMQQAANMAKFNPLMQMPNHPMNNFVSIFDLVEFSLINFSSTILGASKLCRAFTASSTAPTCDASKSNGQNSSTSNQYATNGSSAESNAKSATTKPSSIQSKIGPGNPAKSSDVIVQ